jgi:ribose transport system substrate-binding protein
MTSVRRMLLMTALAVVAALVAACGGSDSSEQSGQAAAPTTTAAATAPATTPAEEPAANAPPATKLDLKLPAKTIGIYCAVCQGETVRRTGMAVKKAVELVGWKAVLVDGEGNPEKQQQVMTALINQKVDAIIGAFLEPGPIAGALEQAKQAKIPVVSVGFPATPSDDVAAVYAGEDDSVSQLLVERMAEELPPNAKVAEVDLPQYYGVTKRKEVWRRTAKEKGFEIAATHAIGDLSKQVVESEKAGLDIINSNPQLTAFWSCCDFAGQPLVRAVNSSGKDITVYSYYALPSVLRYIREGKVIVVEPDNVKAGFQAVEQLAAFFTDGTALDAEAAMSADPPKAKIVDKTNVPADGEEVWPFDVLWAPFAERLTEKYGQA